MEISAETLVRVILLSIYVPVILAVYWRLMPRLSNASRLLATLVLITQALVILVALEYKPRNHTEWFVWRLGQEGNFSNTFSALQMMLVGISALAPAWMARKEPAWRRLYLMALGALFLLLAREELFETRHSVLGPAWVLYYAAIGGAVVGATVFIVARSPRRMRIWYKCLLAGLAISATGALIVEQFRLVEPCVVPVFVQGERCLQEFYEESLEMLGVWLMLIAMLGLYSSSVAKSRRLFGMIPFLLPFLWLYSIHGPVRPWAFEYWFLFQPSSVRFDSNLELGAYRTRSGDGIVTVELFAKVAEWRDYSGLGYSVHLIDQASGASVSGTDDSASRRQSFRVQPVGETNGDYYYKQSMRLAVPQNAPVNRALWIALTVWREEGDAFTHQKILSSDLPLLSDTQLILEELVLPDKSPAQVPPRAVFDNDLALDAVDLPERTRAGDSFSIAFGWRAGKEGAEDYAQFLHFVHQETGAWWGYDQQPLGARLPTRLWYEGLADVERWEVPLPPDLAPGRYDLFTGLYRLSDLEPLPASDGEGAPITDSRVPLGSVTVEQG